jgi:endonuclease/exonuclease/phosphatase family metal-dependent hydrolase
MKAFWKILHSFILTINVAVVLLLIVCGYAYKIKPEFSLSSFLGYGFPVLALINIFFVFYWLFRMKIWILVPLFGIAITYGSYRAWFPLNFNSEQLPEKTIKVLSYNVMYFSYKLKDQPGEGHPILDYIRESGADIVCLQEAGPEFIDKTKRDPVVRKALKEYPYIFSGAQENRFSVVLLSKYPVLHSERIEYASQSNSSFLYDLKIGEDTIRLINNHLESNKLNKDEKNKYTDLLTNRESEQLSVVAEVLGSKVGNATVIRASQADAVSRAVMESPHKVIVCGDFNDVPGSYAYRTVRKGLKDTWIERGQGWGNTFHENLFLFRIDFILHSPQIKAHRVKVDKVRISDHYPIWANLEI